MATDNRSLDTLKDFATTTDIKSKSDKKFGKQIVSKIDTLINSSYFSERNKRFIDNEKLAAGRQDMDLFKKLLDMASTQNYTEYLWKSIKIVNTIIARLVGRWMQTKEKPVATAIDQISIKKKKEKIDEAEFYLENKDVLAGIEQQAGVPVIPKDQFVADDKDHLDIWTKYELHLPEEFKYTQGIRNVFYTNGWGYTGTNRRKLKHDSATYGFVGTYTWADRYGKIHVDRVNPKSAIYSYSEHDDFHDCAWMGHLVSLKLSQIRDQYPELSERELFDNIVPNSKEYPTSNSLTWDDSWASNYSRPYDDWSVDVVMLELKSLDSETYSMKITSNGNLLIEKGEGKNLNGDVSRETKDRWNIYQGVYLRKNKFLLKWDIKENPITPQDYKEVGNAEFSYSYYMYQNVDMRNLAVPEKIEEPVEGMIIARLKIQKMVADMVASGHAIDIDGVQSIDLGTGDGVLTPMQLKRVYKQTGDIYFTSKDADGTRQGIPITELPNTGSVAQLQALITIYNYHLQVVRDEVGINEFAEGQTIKPRTTTDNVQTSLQVSFNATDYINDATLSVMEATAKKVACLLHDSVEFGSEEYREIVGEEDVKDRLYDIKIELSPSDEDVNELMQQVYNFLQGSPDFIMYVNPIKIKKLAEEDLDLAALYFRRAQSKAIKGMEEKARQQSDYNTNAQTQSGIAVAQENQKVEAAKLATDLALAKEKQKEIILTGIFSIYGKGEDIPQQWKVIEQEIVTNLGIPLFSENMGIKQAAAQQQVQPQEQATSEQQPALPQM